MERFEMARKSLPNCVGGFDPFSHKTILDLCWMVRHELDLHEEGEETDIKNKTDVAACKRFLGRWC